MNVYSQINIQQIEIQIDSFSSIFCNKIRNDFEIVKNQLNAIFNV